MYGISCQDIDDQYVQRAVNALQGFNESKTPGRFWIEFMPILKYVPSWVPGASAIKFGNKWRPKVDEMVNIPFDAVKNGTVSISRDDSDLLQSADVLNILQIQSPSIALSLITKLAHEDDIMQRAEAEQHARHATGVAYAGKLPHQIESLMCLNHVTAGTDTVCTDLSLSLFSKIFLYIHQTYSLVQSFFCAAAMYPEIQKKARDELDQVVGSDRLPDFDDQASLPYIQAILMECMRCFPVLPLGVPHRLLADDHFNEYFIPEGTIIIPVCNQSFNYNSFD
jgi:hypothetical protein